jgi:DNA-binding response OmpR family regulator
MSRQKRTILLVEDERSITEPLAAALEREGFDAQVEGTVAGALERARELNPDLVLLDVMLPDGSGFDVCRELRQSSKVPIIMLTARGEEADRVVGLELGADDYVVKPFSAREVVARIRAVRAGRKPQRNRSASERSRSARSGSTRRNVRCGGQASRSS